MFKFLQKIFIGHSHKWIQDSVINVTDSDGTKTPIGRIIVLRCEVCGNMKNHKVKWG